MAFRQRLDEVGYQGTVDYRETEGSHAWRWWSRWLADRHLPFALERLADPAPGEPGTSAVPTSFRYRSIADRFAVWGYDVEVDRDVREFLDLTEVTAGGFTVQGSGRAVVTTADRYRPGRAYQVDGAAEAPTEVVADPEGRLRVIVDLGPSHAHEQFSPEADVDAAAAGAGYWTVRQVTIAEAGAPGAVMSGVGDGGSAGTGGGLVSPSLGSALGSPVAGPAAASVEGDGAARAGRLASASDEIVHRVSAPLTVAFLAALSGGGALWWRRRVHTKAAAA
jgi:hypothetical protein